MISKSLEEYLKTIYILKKQNENVRVTDIANKMNCTKPSVNKAIKNLKENEMVNYQSYGTIELTEKVYLFLKDVLNLEDGQAQEEAENIKSVISDDTTNKLAKYIHKVLGLTNLDCDYDINKEKCRCCARRKIERK